MVERSGVRLPRVVRPGLLAAFTVVVVLVGVLGFVVGAALPRPAAVEGLGDDEPALVTAAVESRVIVDRTVVQGKVTAGDTLEVGHVPREGADMLPYVTAVGAVEGQPLRNGSFVLAVAGRPLVALRVDAPLYRSLRVGDEGADVRAFEAALTAAGGTDFDVDERFTWYTMEAAERLWASLGYDLPTETVTPVPDPGGTDPQTEETTQTGPFEQRYVDVNEIVQLFTDTVAVMSVASVGSLASAEQPLLALRTAPSTVGARITVLEEKAFAAGTEVTLSTSGRSDEIAVVSNVGEFTAGEGEIPPGRDVTVPLPESWGDLPDGTVVRVSVGEESAPVLAVPLTAIRAADSDPHVVVEKAPGREAGDRIVVVVIETAGGWAQIDESSGLAPGDTVRLSP